MESKYSINTKNIIIVINIIKKNDIRRVYNIIINHNNNTSSI